MSNIPSIRLAKKISQVVNDVGWIQKNGKNETQRYKFASASDVFNAVNAACYSHGIVILCDVLPETVRHIEMLTGGEKPKQAIRTEFIMEITLHDTDTEERYTGRFPGMGIDYGDKSANKAITSTRKYGVLGMLGIPTGDDPDPDSRDPDPSVTAPSIESLFGIWRHKYPSITGPTVKRDFKEWVADFCGLSVPAEAWTPSVFDRLRISEVLEKLPISVD